MISMTCRRKPTENPLSVFKLGMSGLFVGSDGGAPHSAIGARSLATAKLNGVEPLAWLTDVLERMVSGRIKAQEVKPLLP